MKIAVLADIHGNLLALEAALADLEAQGGADATVIAGDLCADGPRPREALERVRALGCPVVQGNTDRDLAAPPDPDGDEHEAVLNWTRDQLGAEGLAYLRALPFEHRTPGPNDASTVLVVHANPRNLDDPLRPFAPEAEIAPLLENVAPDVAVVAFGHLHIPYTRQVGRLTLADISSVGLPKDGDRRAGYGLFTWTDGAWVVEQRRVEYPVDEVAAQLRAANIPEVEKLVRTLLRARYPDMTKARGGRAPRARKPSAAAQAQPTSLPAPATPAGGTAPSPDARVTLVNVPPALANQVAPAITEAPDIAAPHDLTDQLATVPATEWPWPQSNERETPKSSAGAPEVQVAAATEDQIIAPPVEPLAGESAPALTFVEPADTPPALATPPPLESATSPASVSEPARSNVTVSTEPAETRQVADGLAAAEAPPVTTETTQATDTTDTEEALAPVAPTAVADLAPVAPLALPEPESTRTDATAPPSKPSRRSRKQAKRAANAVTPLDPNAPFGTAARRLVAERFTILVSYADTVRASADSEAVHDMRVATRRLRAALDAVRPVSKPRRYRAFSQTIKELAGALGAVRDRDVLLDVLRQRLRAAPEAERPGLASLIAGLASEHATHRAALVTLLDHWLPEATRAFERFSDRRDRKPLDRRERAADGADGDGGKTDAQEA